MMEREQQRAYLKQTDDKTSPEKTLHCNIQRSVTGHALNVWEFLFWVVHILQQYEGAC